MLCHLQNEITKSTPWLIYKLNTQLTQVGDLIFNARSFDIDKEEMCIFLQ
jgi:hypothetical protein